MENKRMKKNIEEKKADEQEWIEYRDKCDEMLMDDQFEFATETLEGIRAWIDDHQHVTDKQKESIENIMSSVEERY